MVLGLVGKRIDHWDRVRNVSLIFGILSLKNKDWDLCTDRRGRTKGGR